MPIDLKKKDGFTDIARSIGMISPQGTMINVPHDQLDTAKSSGYQLPNEFSPIKSAIGMGTGGRRQELNQGKATAQKLLTDIQNTKSTFDPNQDIARTAAAGGAPSEATVVPTPAPSTGAVPGSINIPSAKSVTMYKEGRTVTVTPENQKGMEALGYTTSVPTIPSNQNADEINAGKGGTVEGYTPPAKATDKSDLSSKESDIKKAQDEADRMRAGNFTDYEKQQIEQSTLATKVKYDELIRNAEAAKAEGLPKALMGAGRAGGFMNTQYAGAAALPSSLGGGALAGGGFFGVGGELETIKSSYDAEILNLRGQQQVAMLDAENAAKQALISGNKDHVKAAEDAYTRAKELETHILSIQKAKTEQIASATKLQSDQLNLSKATADAFSSGLVNVDDKGGVIMPTDAQIVDQASRQGIDSDILRGSINERVDKLRKLSQDDLKVQNLIDKTQLSMLTPKQKEYRLAVDQGYKGTWFDYLKDAVTKSSTSGQPLDAETLDFVAGNYIKTGVMPNLGWGAAGAQQRTQVLTRAAQLAAGTGQDLAVNKALYDARKSALAQTMKTQAATDRAEKNVIANVSLLKALSSRTDRTGSPLVNKYLLFLTGQVKGDSDTLAFQGVIATIATEFAKVTTGSLGNAAVTDSARQEREKVLNAALGNGTLNEVLGAMQIEMENTKQSYVDQLDELKQSVQGAGAGAVPSTPTFGGITTQPDDYSKAKTPDEIFGL